MSIIFDAFDFSGQKSNGQDTVLFLQPIPGIHHQAKSQADVLKSIPQSPLIRQ